MESTLSKTSGHPLVIIVGPTASGKTALSLSLGEKFAAEIVSCDSVAVYREFEIGTAKPSREQRAVAPHHLIDVAAPGELFTAGEYSRIARGLLNEIKARRKLPIVVAGTGLYLRALLQGLFAGPQRSEDLRERLRQRALERGPAYLHRLLCRLDPESAARIHSNDQPKLIRAIEVCIEARQKMSDMWQRGREPLTGFAIIRVGLDPDRNQLYDRINQRARHMFDAGLVAETKGLLAKYSYPGESEEALDSKSTALHKPVARALSSLGYKQAVQYIRGEIDGKRMVWAGQQAHRNYAKRQATWFRREPSMKWFKGFGDHTEIQAQVIGFLKSHPEWSVVQETKPTIPRQ